MKRRPVDVADDDPRRCPAAAVGDFHDFDDYADLVEGDCVGLLEQCKHCGIYIHALLEALSAYVDRRPAATVLADDIAAQVRRKYARQPLPTRGSFTVFADAQMVLAVMGGDK